MSNPPKTAGKKNKSAGTGEPKEKSEALASSSALIICRNKHWRYISSFHGPWLQLPPEVLTSLLHSNHHAPRPRPIDPSVLSDLVQIRHLVDDATTLAVRAASSSTPRLSRERKHRMRELATQKLSRAYHLDEIAASVATMQSASSLEDVAALVLQRNPDDPDAKYVHFFHEKIPSRMLAKCTSLAPLDDVIAERPGEGAPLRTRAVTKAFKDDHVSAAADLTAALNVCRPARHGHDVVVARGGAAAATEEQQQTPSSLEAQLLFHRASTYLTIAAGAVETALDRPKAGAAPVEEAEKEAARKVVRANAKRALRDFVRFLGNFEYTPGLPAETRDEFVRKVNEELGRGRGSESGNTEKDAKKLLEMFYRQNSSSSTASDSSNGGSSSSSSALTRISGGGGGGGGYSGTSTGSRPFTSLPPPPVYALSALFTSPPSSLPPYPCTALTTASAPPPTPTSAALTALLSDSTESITYHPLLTDALHSLLLCHVLLSTPPKELLRHAHMVARLARVCDGYPIFLAARSPARADWIEVLRKTGNFVGIEGSWEALCSPAPLGGGGGPQAPKRWAQEEGGKEYPVVTERAGWLARWVKDVARRERARVEDGTEVAVVPQQQRRKKAPAKSGAVVVGAASAAS
ncbi:uncharacterized protein H6S33_000850 [Morchella sextelata]|uniref:uncharacterized protein n=1 Tax=Morchella sextelata TaxID=1174677 RepID=UPI001D049243|nr:uncharacterized protein H6S33_000850 [Morchella sextelata]KAH0615214.1 hypothetical protein H6S33_000850 [Morchella sextelata]